jgi:hypothetical protein
LELSHIAPAGIAVRRGTIADPEATKSSRAEKKSKPNSKPHRSPYANSAVPPTAPDCTFRDFEEKVIENRGNLPTFLRQAATGRATAGVFSEGRCARPSRMRFSVPSFQFFV